MRPKSAPNTRSRRGRHTTPRRPVPAPYMRQRLPLFFDLKAGKMRREGNDDRLFARNGPPFGVMVQECPLRTQPPRKCGPGWPTPPLLASPEAGAGDSSPSVRRRTGSAPGCAAPAHRHHPEMSAHRKLLYSPGSVGTRSQPQRPPSCLLNGLGPGLHGVPISRLLSTNDSTHE